MRCPAVSIQVKVSSKQVKVVSIQVKVNSIQVKAVSIQVKIVSIQVKVNLIFGPRTVPSPSGTKLILQVTSHLFKIFIHISLSIIQANCSAIQAIPARLKQARLV